MDVTSKWKNSFEARSSLLNLQADTLMLQTHILFRIIKVNIEYLITIFIPKML